MTMQRLIRLVIAEFHARGWDAVLHGPEAHLVLPWVGGAILAVAVYLIIREGRRK